MLPLPKAIHLYQGDTYSLKFRLKTKDGNDVVTPVDLTGATVKAQIRDFKIDQSASTPIDFTAVILDAPGGLIELKLSTTQTAAIEGGRWDVQITFTDGTVRTYLKGNVSVKSQVTV